MSKANSLVWLWLSSVAVIFDQITKNIASEKLVYYQSVEVIPGLNMTLVHNTGAAFSFLSQAGGWQRWFFIVLTSSISAGLVYWLYTLPRNKVWLASALSLVLGGALGNLWDRVKFGYVIDFIDVYYQSWHWPAFNVADSCICIGAGMLIVDAIWFDRAEVTTHNKS